MSRYRHREVLHMNIEPEKRKGRQNGTRRNGLRTFNYYFNNTVTCT